MKKHRLREDLIAIRKVRHGEVEYVIKDPIHMEYYRLTELEYDVAMLFDGNRGPEEILAAVNEGCEEDEFIDPNELIGFVQNLASMNLFEKSSKEKNAMILARMREDRKSKLTSKKGSLIYKRIPLMDPKEWFGWLYPKVSFFFTPTFVVISMLMMLGSGAIILANWDTVAEGIKNLVTFQQDHAYGYFTLWIVVLFVIALHEHGHGMTCVHFGGEVREMGMLFLFFQPCLYCNVSDAWTFADRGKRLWVTAAGGYFEFWIGSIFTYIWWLTAEGTVINTISYQAMTVCGLSSVLFNFNPLIKLDGYYILCDLLEVNNLKQQSLVYLKACTKHFIFGAKMDDFEFTDKEKRAYLIYGISSSIYIFGLLTGIFIMVAGLAIPVLGEIGFVLAMLLGYKLFFKYLKGSVSFVLQAVTKAGKMALSKQGRWIAGSLGVIAIIILCLPVVHRIEGNVKLKPAGDVTVHAQAGGTIEEILVKAGSRVAKGDVLVRMKNTMLENAAEKLRLEITNLELDVNSLSGQADPLAEQRLKSQLREMRQRYKEINKDLNGLVVCAPIDGVVITDYLEQRIDEYIGVGAPICQILNPSVMLAEVDVLEREVKSISKGDAASIQLVAMPDVSVVSTVKKVYSPRPEDNEGLGTAMAQSFRVQIYLNNKDEGDGLGKFRSGMSGKAKIDVGRRIMALHLWDNLRKNMKSDALFF